MCIYMYSFTICVVRSCPTELYNPKLYIFLFCLATPVVQLPMLHEATLGRNITLTCVASDATFFKWYFSGTQILSKGRFDITGKGNHRSLHIRDVIMTDRGEYTCIAFNIAGSAMNSTQLDVLGEGEECSLRCVG